jgi:hypothetical protein
MGVDLDRPGVAFVEALVQVERQGDGMGRVDGEAREAVARRGPFLEEIGHEKAARSGEDAGIHEAQQLGAAPPQGEVGEEDPQKDVGNAPVTGNEGPVGSPRIQGSCRRVGWACCERSLDRTRKCRTMRTTRRKPRGPAVSHSGKANRRRNEGEGWPAGWSLGRPSKW